MITKLSSRTQIVVDAILAHIRENGLVGGDPLPSEGDIATSAGVSRTSVREAFGAMAALRLIDVSGGRRAKVGVVQGDVMGIPLAHAVGTSQVSVAQVWDARRSLERRTAELAAMQRTEKEAAAIKSHATAMRNAGGDIELQTEHDIAFHQAIARATRNPAFPLMIDAFANLMRETCPIGWYSRKTEAERMTVFDQHDRIAQAIADRKPVEAEQAMRDHFDLSLKALSDAGFN